MEEETKIWITLTIVTVVFISLGLGIWVYQSKVESDTYNRITGKDITHWEAMWTNLRVDCN